MPRFSYRYRQHPTQGWRLVELRAVDDATQAETSAAFAPELGSNLLHFAVGSTEYLCDVAAGDSSQLLGTPILYPSPNRVRNASFSFDGITYRFEPNNGANFIHGLVRDVPWECEEPRVLPGSVAVTTRVHFEPGSPLYERFPIRNTIELTYSVRPGVVRFEFAVINRDDSRRLPFGLAIHPYFRILGSREQVRIQVPAQRWMEAIDLLPTGRLIPLEQAPADLREPTALRDLNLDDVYWGLTPDKPQVIFYDSIGKKVTLRASDLFTHSVVYTPQSKPFFCIENQSCSTDAHNLNAQGLDIAAHLWILEPGQSLTSWIELSVTDQ